jgi:hypothetical protein
MPGNIKKGETVNINEEIKKVEEICQNKIKAIENLRGIEDLIEWVGETGPYTHPLSVEEFKNVLHEFKTKLGNYKIGVYWMLSRGLCVEYNFKDIFINMVCNEPEKMLKELSKGKCRIEEKTSISTCVVCDL